MKFNLLPYARSRKLLAILNRTLICVMLFLLMYFIFEKINLKNQMNQSLRLEKKLSQLNTSTIQARLWISHSMQNNKSIKKIIVNISQSLPEKMQLQQLTLNEKMLRLKGMDDQPSVLEHFIKIFDAYPYQPIHNSSPKNKNSLKFTLNYENAHVDSPKNLY